MQVTDCKEHYFKDDVPNLKYNLNFMLYTAFFLVKLELILVDISANLTNKFQRVSLKLNLEKLIL